jgi:predicted PurR-regulated permease PerM
MLMDNLNKRPTTTEIVAWVCAAVLLIFILIFHLLPALLAGLLVFELVHIISPYVAKHLPGQRSKFIALGLLAFTIISLLTMAGIGLVTFLRSDAAGLTLLFDKMAEIIEGSRAMSPAWLLSYLPADAETLRVSVTAWLRTHAAELQLAGKEIARLAAHILVGMIIGGILAVRDVELTHKYKPFARAMAERALRLSTAFRRIVFAQVRIATINATFTAIYLVIVLPVMGVHLPLTKTMIAITFVVGLIPVIGNLMSNTIIVIVSLSQSINIAIGSLVFLILIHKLEYFLNARIVGSQIHARAWELLLAMLLMESIFGIVGVIAAPIYYAYIKDELSARGWV